MGNLKALREGKRCGERKEETHDGGKGDSKGREREKSGEREGELRKRRQEKVRTGVGGKHDSHKNERRLHLLSTGRCSAPLSTPHADIPGYPPQAHEVHIAISPVLQRRRLRFREIKRPGQRDTAK